MILLGIILFILGKIFHSEYSGVLTNIGIVLVVIGAILWVLGRIGHPVGGRRHWF